MAISDQLTDFDAFTVQHLREYADVSVFDCERNDFIVYTLMAVDADPQLVRYGWPPLYRSFIYERYA